MFGLHERLAQGAVFRSPTHLLRVLFYSDDCVRVTYTADAAFPSRASRIVIADPTPTSVSVEQDTERITLSSATLRVEITLATGRLRYLTVAGTLLMQEPEREGKWLTRKQVTRNVFARDTSVRVGESIDGARAVATKYETRFDREAFEARLEFAFSAKEALYGLGSHVEGYGNLRGRSRELYQQNMKAVVPHLVSTRGYGVLLDCSSLMTFHDDASGSFWWADVVDALDFYVLGGGSYEAVMREYRALVGAPPLLPKWAFGYVQSKERYVTAEEMVAVVAEYRRRNIPLDTIVLDWKSWPNGAGWGQKSFDPARFPDPERFIEQLHAMGAKLMVSIWPIMTGGCADQRELLQAGQMLGNGSTYNAFDRGARETYWAQAERGLFACGVDAWWCDCTEPFEADWSGAEKPSPEERLRLNTTESKLYLDAGEINAYSLMHSQGIFEGQRRRTDDKRVVNLTRSSYAGQSRYGTVTWNGDICATWETLRRSIAEGLNFCATGEPYWTVDIGGFFIDHRDDLWFWRGDYHDGTRGLTDMNALAPDENDAGCRDLGFAELYVRWLEYAVFLPMFRSHGTDAAREIWRFGEDGTPFYDAIASNIQLRYRLLPYIYSVAAAVAFSAASMVRALALAFPADFATYDVTDQFLFGPSLMACPVTQPMLYARNSRALEDVPQCRDIYLPQCAGWYDFHTGHHYAGGTTIRAEAPLERIPVFALAGSIVVLSEVMQFVDEHPDAPWDIHVYTGADATFALYEDAGDGYAYERGERATVLLQWKEADAEFVFAARAGEFPQLVRERNAHVVIHAPDVNHEYDLRYDGREQRLVMKELRRG